MPTPHLENPVHLAESAYNDLPDSANPPVRSSLDAPFDFDRQRPKARRSVRGLLGVAVLVASVFALGTTGAAADTHDTATFSGTVSEIVDPAAETGIPRRWMRHVGDPAPDGYSHGYQWGAPAITTPADAEVVTFTGSIDVVDAASGDLGLVGLLDTATLAADERGLNEGAYIYLFLKNDNTLVIGLSDGRATGGEYVQTFHTVDLTGTDRTFDVAFTIDAMADPVGCATDAGDVGTAEGCMSLAVDELPVLTDSYGTITNAVANGGVEFVDGGTAGWDGLASAAAATGIDYDFTIEPVVPSALTSPDDCRDGGYAAYDFRNQGQCIASIRANEAAGLGG